MKFSAKNNLPEEVERIAVLENLLQRYKVPEFTSEIMVEKGVIPHSHPILTLNTRTHSDLSILKNLVHEQFHWYADGHPRLRECTTYLKTKYQDDGEHNKRGKNPNAYWDHIIVCFNTRKYLMTILSAEEIDSIYNEWQAYPTLEKKIADNLDHFGAELELFDMVYRG